MIYMAGAGYDPQGAVTLQKTFVSLSEDRKEDWLSGLFASHPPSAERVRNNAETAASLAAGGEMGRERYQREIAFLKRVEPGYLAYDEAGKALSEGNSRLAQKKLNTALNVEPREALFKALQGDIYRKEDRLNQALQAYDSTIKANPGLFYGYLRKGQLEYERDRFEAARSPLEKSLGMLPTAEAHYLLGMIDKRAGRRDQAISHFQVAAQSQSNSGKRAQGELERMELSTNPERSVATQLAQDANGYVWVQLVNRTQLPLENIDVQFAWIDEQGQMRRGTERYRGPLGAGQKDQLRLNIRLPLVNDLSRRVQVETGSATIAQR
jgi:tetratricopeptide (TPR) repeat protein